jgi:hypothetical protein
MTALLFSLCTKVVAQEKQQKEESTLQTNLLFKNYYDKTTLKLKTKTEKWLPIKKYADLTTKEKI